LIKPERNAPTKDEQYQNKKPAAATVFEDVVVLVEVTVYSPSRRCGLKESKNANDEFRPVFYLKTRIKISVYSFEMRELYSKKSIKP
jgi:hypothetical protein